MEFDAEYPGTAVQRLHSVHDRVKSLTPEQLSGDWQTVRRKLLWAGVIHWGLTSAIVHQKASDSSNGLMHFYPRLLRQLEGKRFSRHSISRILNTRMPYPVLTKSSNGE